MVTEFAIFVEITSESVMFERNDYSYFLLGAQNYVLSEGGPRELVEGRLEHAADEREEAPAGADEAGKRDLSPRGTIKWPAF